MKKEADFSAADLEIIGALSDFSDAIASGEPIEEKFTIRTVELKLQPRSYNPEDVKKTRALLKASQPLFAKFLGVDVKTIRSWEQGLRAPSPMACRFMDEINLSPEHWGERLLNVISTKVREPKTTDLPQNICKKRPPRKVNS
ncbi:helix-turn-helix domain-containing protein [Singulisphaera acidiphila]|uniref:Putative transcriptional regulator n=1 Tax=Singulisphaera acidiphila (strain ATCC BAA-1392 / DSM 18658 / VKM B-2454 / MOB10) TaxID=886293 RepID=L0D9V6_SINAD|nr:transcriptional regulator [Singulisphaera acidiphila]AGA26027.1 putative transcriptional regulator [Singulisphaera acidiphila DSM 18658]